MSTTTNSQGYQQYTQDPASATLQASNPWATSLASDQQAQVNNTAQSNQNISTLQSQMGNYGASTDGSSYPALANQWNLGNTGQAAAGSASGTGFGANPVTLNMPDTSSRGFNPWSLQGESNAREGTKS